ncbi:MAG: sensor histidine kinase [Verrucomicrobiales bacterium]
MNRPWHRWMGFGLCLAVVAGALGWMTAALLRLDHTRQTSERQAALEERVRLALWRMDSALTALIVEESARPAHDYRPLREADQALERVSNRLLAPGEILVPSPLQNFTSPHIKLHFQREHDGTLISPQVPEPAEGKSAPRDADSENHSPREYRGRLAELDRLLRQPASAHRAAPLTAAAEGGPVNSLILLQESSAAPGLPVASTATPSRQAGTVEEGMVAAELQQQMSNSAELQSRAAVYQQATQLATANANWWGATAPSASDAAALVFKALWLGDDLVLARRVAGASGLVVQGVWIDWPALRATLLSSINDLFPQASLRPAAPDAATDAGRRLATLPLELVPDWEPEHPVRQWTPLHISLCLAWMGATVAAAAAGSLLHGTLSLSERRAAFVSAVTHELRTPLTTFQLYSEMLADGMVTDPDQRKGYLDTLRAEATRLGHLVENVLAYARLERGSARQRVEAVRLSELLDHVKPRLAQRTEQAGLTLVTEAVGAGPAATVRVDVAAVEQILFNLVDNACKYAAPEAVDKRLHLEALASPGDRGFMTLRVRDHGPGISADAAKRLFTPFSRSAAEAARGVPGVGLGLALSRRISRELGGDLRRDASVAEGAAFVLSLPVAATTQ